MTPEQINRAIAQACGWRPWTYGDPLIEKQRFADTKFNGYVRQIVRVYGTRGATLDMDDSPIYATDLFGEGREFKPLSGWRSPKGRWKPNCPDYYTNLNAMHEAEKVLVSWDDPQNAGHYVWKDSYGAYVGWLAKLTGSLYFHPKADSGEFRKLISATAAQRAEAFLRTLNLWTD